MRAQKIYQPVLDAQRGDQVSNSGGGVTHLGGCQGLVSAAQVALQQAVLVLQLPDLAAHLQQLSPQTVALGYPRVQRRLLAVGGGTCLPQMCHILGNHLR